MYSSNDHRSTYMNLEQHNFSLINAPFHEYAPIPQNSTSNYHLVKQPQVKVKLLNYCSSAHDVRQITPMYRVPRVI